ncbi:hypothetical protein P9112_012320 [Eukaryota sp. TZLM1-RC]
MIGFLGFRPSCFHLADAVLSKTGPQNICVYDVHESYVHQARKRNMHVLESCAAVTEKCDILFMCADDDDLDISFHSFKLAKNRLLVSAIEGLRANDIDKKYGGLVRKVCIAFESDQQIILASNDTSTKFDADLVLELFPTSFEKFLVPESQILTYSLLGRESLNILLLVVDFINESVHQTDLAIDSNIAATVIWKSLQYLGRISVDSDGVSLLRNRLDITLDKNSFVREFVDALGGIRRKKERLYKKI